ncbi:MAG: 3-deoxy-D-manno-octulosonic acid transferase [Maricaulaceae bacterium]
MTSTLPLRLYSSLMRAASPLLRIYLARRAKAGKEDSARLSERFGKAYLPRPNGKLIWVHGASVGETLTALPIIYWILETDETAHVIVTSGTVTSAEMLKQRLPERAFHQYLPADTPAYAKRFLSHWQPDACLWFESDIWPNILRATKARNIPMQLLNARLSKSSRDGWMKRPQTAKVLFSLFGDILPADDDTAEFLSEILGRNIDTFGNLKITAARLPAPDKDLKHIRGAIKNSFYNWCAASTHAGEDEIILDAHLDILKQFPDASLTLVPRHPERADDIIAHIQKRKLSYARWGHAPSKSVDVLLVDQMGKMGAVYLASKVVLMGGSLLPHLRGHNPMEPAHFNCGIINGPYVSSFQALFDNMNKINAAFLLESPDAHSIAERVKIWFQHDGTRARRAQKARSFTTLNDGLLTQVTDHLSPFISPPSRLD